MSAETPAVHVTWWRRIVNSLAALGDSPGRTAAAFALGVFLSFSPFLGFQIAAGMLAAVVFRLSKVAVFVGLNANLPWIMIPWYVLTTAVAGSVLGLPGASDMSDRLAQVLEEPFYRAVFWRRFVELLGPYFWSFLIGPTAGAVVLGVVAYFLTHRVLANPSTAQGGALRQAQGRATVRAAPRKRSTAFP